MFEILRLSVAYIFLLYSIASLTVLGSIPRFHDVAFHLPFQNISHVFRTLKVCFRAFLVTKLLGMHLRYTLTYVFLNSVLKLNLHCVNFLGISNKCLWPVSSFQLEQEHIFFHYDEYLCLEKRRSNFYFCMPYQNCGKCWGRSDRGSSWRPCHTLLSGRMQRMQILQIGKDKPVRESPGSYRSWCDDERPQKSFLNQWKTYLPFHGDINLQSVHSGA